jgi:magnesium chelatase subunit D
VKQEEINDATWVAGLLALGGPDLGGVIVTTEVVDEFSAAFGKATEPRGALRIVSSTMSADALAGSVDLAATLAFGKPVYTEGLLATHPRLMVRRAERLDVACTSLLAQALDQNQLLLITVIDSYDPDAVLAAKLEARLPFLVDEPAEPYWSSSDIQRAKIRFENAPIDPKWVQDLCGAALAIGISSPRDVLQAVVTARAIAALQGIQVDEASVAMAARLVLAHRAQHAPPQEQEDDQQQPLPPPQSPNSNEAEDNTELNPGDAELILDAIKSALPANLLNLAADGLGKRGAGRNVKSASPRKPGGQRGRRIGHKRASSLAGQRLDILATLRNAAPWQALRRKLAGENRMVVTRDDFRVSRIKQRNEATAIFAVDASGSTAFQRLAEAKGAVETILAECYVRRDRVALVAFRGKKAELLLPPTRSLERAKRALAGLPGGGGTPLASGLDEAYELAIQVRRAGGNPIIIVLTDGKANITRSGLGNKVTALEETQTAAKLFAAEGFDALVIDVSSEPQKSARALANNMQATYLPMPRASASEIARPVSMALKNASA